MVLAGRGFDCAVRRCSVCAAVLSMQCWVFSEPASAQWVAKSLHLSGSQETVALGVFANQQAGHAYVGVSSVRHAVVWAGSAGSLVDLSPTGATASDAVAADNGRQVGWVTKGGSDRASLWNGSSASWVDLNPIGASDSYATGVSGNQQVGIARAPGEVASLWTGTPGSWVNLNPTGAGSSRASGVHGGHQVGQAYVSDSKGAFTRASLWSGTAGSWVDLSPPGAPFSAAYGVHGSQQVGTVRMDGVNKASLWTGTAASWVSLHPASAVFSEALGVSGGTQVGFAFLTTHHASLWTGTAGSWQDLHVFLPPRYSSSVATAVWTDGVTTVVVGYGFNDLTSQVEALLWTDRCPSDFNGDGFVNGDDFDEYSLAFIAGTAPADFNGDGFVNGDDFDGFVLAFESGC